MLAHKDCQLRDHSKDPGYNLVRLKGCALSSRSNFTNSTLQVSSSRFTSLTLVVPYFEFHRKRSTKSHETALNYFGCGPNGLLHVISWIVLPSLARAPAIKSAESYSNSRSLIGCGNPSTLLRPDDRDRAGGIAASVPAH
jgi:hypothetical protein